MKIKQEHKPFLVILFLIGLLMLTATSEEMDEKKEAGAGRVGLGIALVVVGIVMWVASAGTSLPVSIIMIIVGSIAIGGFSLFSGIFSLSSPKPVIPPYVYIGGFLVLIFMFISKKKNK